LPPSSGLKSKLTKKPARSRQKVKLTLQPWRWRLFVPSKHKSTFRGLHGVISQGIKVFTFPFRLKLSNRCSRNDIVMTVIIDRQIYSHAK
jgi:hypothetical protein